MERLRKVRTAAGVAWLVVLSLVGQTALGRDVKLAVRPQKAAAEVGKYALFPPVASLTEGDAVPLYEKAVKALPGKALGDQVEKWLRLPIDQLPLDEAEKALTQCVESLKGAARAIKCRDCRWPVLASESLTAHLQQYHRLVSALRLWARYEIAQENYEGAVLALQTGFGMGKHLMQGPTLEEYLYGIAAANRVCIDVEEFVQAGEAPNLYAALAALPKPFTDVERLIEADKKAIPSEPPAGMSQAKFESALRQLPKQHNLVRIVAKRLETDLAALQGVEAIRSYAASHGGQLPQTLGEITEVTVPNDPMSGAAFRYGRTGAAAILESATPAGGNAKDVTRYEITVKN